MSLRVLAAAVYLAWAIPASAQQGVKLEFNEGMVSLTAQNASVAAILAEWARVGGATIINGDRLAGPPLTLELTNVTERQALDTLLRNAAGYMLAPRRAGTSGLSTFDRIMIMPTSVGPRNPAPAPPAALGGPRPIGVPRPPVVAVPAEANDDPPEQTEADGPDDARESAPPRVVQPVFGAPRPLVPPPAAPGQPSAEAPEDGDQPADTGVPAPGARPTPGNPFGIPFGSSPTPGIVTPVPAPRQTPPPNGPPGR